MVKPPGARRRAPRPECLLGGPAPPTVTPPGGAAPGVGAPAAVRGYWLLRGYVHLRFRGLGRWTLRGRLAPFKKKGAGCPSPSAAVAGDWRGAARAAWP